MNHCAQVDPSLSCWTNSGVWRSQRGGQPLPLRYRWRNTDTSKCQHELDFHKPQWWYTWPIYLFVKCHTEVIIHNKWLIKCHNKEMGIYIYIYELVSRIRFLPNLLTNRWKTIEYCESWTSLGHLMDLYLSAVMFKTQRCPLVIPLPTESKVAMRNSISPYSQCLRYLADLAIEHHRLPTPTLIGSNSSFPAVISDNKINQYQLVSQITGEF